MSNILGSRRVRFPAVIVAAALGLAACGDDITNNNAGPATFTPLDIGVTNATLQTALDAAVAVGTAGNGGLGSPDVGDSGGSSRRRRGRRPQRYRRGRSVARQPGHLGPEGEHRQRFQPGWACPFERESLRPLRNRAAASSACRRAIRLMQPWSTAATSTSYGTETDFMVGKKPGGINVFGGGLALYDATGVLIGAVGLSGDTSCADHNIAWRVRDGLGPEFCCGAGVDADLTDDIIYDLADDGNGHFVSASGFGHPICGFGENAF